MSNSVAVAENTLFIPAESVTGPVGAVYQKQIAFWQAEHTYEWMLEQVRDDWDRQGRAGHRPIGNPEDSCRSEHRAMEQARTEMEQAQTEIGGIVMCVEIHNNLPKAIKRMEALSRRSVKLGLDPITFKVTEETILLNYTYDYDGQRGYNADFEHVYCILNGGTPKVDGFHFLATIEHTPAGNIVKKIPPVAAQMRGLLPGGPEEKAAEALEAIDVTAYRTVEPICEHCNMIRSRKDTYLVYNDETGEIKQVGRTCLRDYTGADNPEAIVKHLEHFFEAMRFDNTERPKPVILTRDLIAHAFAAGLDQDGRYVKWQTREDALRNYWDMQVEKTYDGEPTYTVPSESHYTLADSTIDWALNIWQETNDFAYNVKTAIANEVAPERSYGIIVAVLAAKQRWDGQEAERQQEEAKPQGGYVGTPGERITFKAELTLLKYLGENDYGNDKFLVKFIDNDGNELAWYSTSALRTKDTHKSLAEGESYNVTATIKSHREDPRYGKSTIITRSAVKEA